MRDLSATCKLCNKVSAVPKDFNEALNFLECPECRSKCYLNQKSVRTMIQELRLSTDELTFKEAVIVPQRSRRS
jgi:hypothetical protein